MRQRVSILKISGKMADSVRKRVRRLRQTPSGTARRAKLRRFIKSILEHADQPPVLFFCQYVDMWSMFYVFEEMCRSERRRPTVVHELDGRIVTCYRMPDGGALVKKLRSLLRTRILYRADMQEERWLCRLLLEAALAWELMCGDSVLLVMREVVGPNVLDDEVRESLKVRKFPRSRNLVGRFKGGWYDAKTVVVK